MSSTPNTSMSMTRNNAIQPPGDLCVWAVVIAGSLLSASESFAKWIVFPEWLIMRAGRVEGNPVRFFVDMEKVDQQFRSVDTVSIPSEVSFGATGVACLPRSGTNGRWQ